MTRKQRRFIYEGAAICMADVLFVALAMPALINSHDTMAFFAGGLLAVGALTWTAYYIYRANKEAF